MDTYDPTEEWAGGEEAILAEHAVANRPLKVLGGTNTGWSARSGDISHEWGWIVVGTKGCGNLGECYLRGRTHRTRALVRAGKEKWLRDRGIPAPVAEVAVAMPCGMELEVAELAETLFAWKRATGQLPSRPHSRREWKAMGIESDEISMPRVWAAFAIAEAVML